MAHRVTVRNARRTVDVDDGETILDAAILAGIDYPCNCQSGTCGSCKSDLFSGEVDMMPYAGFALSDDERAAGAILACRAAPRSDCEVGWHVPDEIARHPRRKLTCLVADVEQAAPEVCRLRLDVADPRRFAFSAGQYASLTFAGLPPRDFSMANRPIDPQLEFHIRRIADGRVSAFVADRLRRGDKVGLEGPFGNAQLRRKHRGPIYAIAGSTGLAPILSIVETALGIGISRPIHLYFGARDAAGIYATERLAGLARAHPNLHVETTLAAPGATGCRPGLVTDALAADHTSFEDAKAYVAGPPAMVEAATEIMVSRGLARRDCHADPFFTEAEKAAAAS